MPTIAVFRISAAGCLAEPRSPPPDEDHDAHTGSGYLPRERPSWQKAVSALLWMDLLDDPLIR